MKIGVAFGDHVRTEKVKKRRYFDSPQVTMRDSLLLLLLFAGVGVLFAKLITLQIFQGYYYRGLSDSNRIRTKIIHAPRGVVFDRYGTPLVFNLPGFRKTVGDKSVLLSRDQALTLLAKNQQNLEVDSLREYPFKDVFAHVMGYVGQISPE